jgi:hypothetical protein
MYYINYDMNTTTTPTLKKLKTTAELATQIELGIHHAKSDFASYGNAHCALYENDLAYICPRNDKNRRKKLVEFAAQYGFRLKFYHEGLFAIFGLRVPPVAVGAL